MAEEDKGEMANKFPKLKGKRHYHDWVVPMRASMRLDDFWKYVEKAEGYKKRREEIAVSLLELGIDSTLYPHIRGLSTAKEIWLKLERVLGGDGLVRRVQLMSQLINTKRNDCKSMEDYVSKVVNTVHQLNKINFAVTDDWACTFLLADLPRVIRTNGDGTSEQWQGVIIGGPPSVIDSAWY